MTWGTILFPYGRIGSDSRTVGNRRDVVRSPQQVGGGGGVTTFAEERGHLKCPRVKNLILGEFVAEMEKLRVWDGAPEEEEV